MHLTNITAAGLKGRSFSHSLSPCTLISGPNDSGKSAIIDAIRLTLCGHLPELGARNQDTMRLCTGRLLTVEAQTDGHRTITRTWTQGEKGVSQKEQLPSDVQISMNPLLTPDEYFGLSEDKRIDYVFTRVPMPDGYDTERIVNEIGKVLEEGDDLTTHDEEAIVSIQKWARETIAKAENFPAGLIAFLAKDGLLKTQYTYWNKRAKDQIGAVRTLKELDKQAASFSDAELKKLQAEIQAQETRCLALASEAGELAAQQQQAERAEQRREAMRQEQGTLSQDFAATIAKLEKQREALAGQIVTLVKMEDAILATRRSEATEEKQILAAKLGTLVAHIASLNAELEASSTVDHCDKCGCSGKAFEKLRATLVTKLTQSIEESELRATVLRDAIAKQETIINETVIEQSARAEIADGNSEIQEQIDGINAELNELKRLQQQAATRLAEIAKELAEETPAPSTEDLAAARLAQTQAAFALTTLREKEKVVLSCQTHYQAAQNAKHEYDQAESFVKAIKAAGDRIKDVQAEMIEQVFGHVCATANRIVGDLLFSPILFRDGEVGRMEGDTFIPHHAFGGTMKILTYLAIAAALSSNAPFRLLILDEMGRLSAQMQGRTLKRFGEAVEAGLLDQVICVIPRDTPITAPNGWTTINLTAQS